MIIYYIHKIKIIGHIEFLLNHLHKHERKDIIIKNHQSDNFMPDVSFKVIYINQSDNLI